MSDRGTWKITVGGTTLADYSDVLKADPVQLGRAFDDAMLYQADDAVYFDRKNRKHVRHYTMTRAHATNAASAAWFMTGAAAFVSVADVVITHKDHTGTETSWTISAAKCEITVDEPIGVSTTTHITITGGLPVIVAS